MTVKLSHKYHCTCITKKIFGLKYSVHKLTQNYVNFKRMRRLVPLKYRLAVSYKAEIDIVFYTEGVVSLWMQLTGFCTFF